MSKSNFFTEISSAYDAEIEDLTSDSEGKSVLAARLKEKRDQLDALIEMLEFAPEMVIPVFYQAFKFKDPAVLSLTAQSEPDDGDFPGWDELAEALTIEPWALPLIEKALNANGGPRFLVTAAVAEFLRVHDVQRVAPAVEMAPKEEDGDDEEINDLAEAGADWVAEQGFDTQNS